MKRITTLVTAFVLVLLLVACGNDTEPTEEFIEPTAEDIAFESSRMSQEPTDNSG